MSYNKCEIRRTINWAPLKKKWIEIIAIILDLVLIKYFTRETKKRENLPCPDQSVFSSPLRRSLSSSRWRVLAGNSKTIVTLPRHIKEKEKKNFEVQNVDERRRTSRCYRISSTEEPLWLEERWLEVLRPIIVSQIPMVSVLAKNCGWRDVRRKRKCYSSYRLADVVLL